MTLSSTYYDLGVSDLQKFENMPDHANLNEFSISAYKLVFRHIKLNEAPLTSLARGKFEYLKHGYFDLAHEKITIGEVRHLVHRAEELCQGCEAYTEYKMLKLFSSDDKKGKNFYGYPPGTVRIFSRRLISYWNGKDWRKISLPGL